MTTLRDGASGFYCTDVKEAEIFGPEISPAPAAMFETIHYGPAKYDIEMFGYSIVLWHVNSLISLLLSLTL